MIKNKNKIAVAMSGGVDSSVSAALLKKMGYDCIGIFMKFWHDEKLPDTQGQNRCCSQESYLRAKSVADYLDIPLYTLNFKKKFKQNVVDKFLHEYRKGKTPNPCINCNKFIKFDLLLKRILVLGCTQLATGHYAIKRKLKNGSYALMKGKDKKKDQTYFLYNLNQDLLSRVIFPVGGLNKDKVKKLAKKLRLPVLWKEESQEICFVPPKKLGVFLKQNLRLKPGRIIDKKNNNLGRHDGLALYTLGQRKNIKLSGGPYYVMKKDLKNNTLMVTKKPAEISSNKFKISDCSWVINPPQPGKVYNIQIRYRTKAEPGRIKINKKYCEIILNRKVFAVTAGQSAVIYDKNELIGGGVIN
ncbi:tRNA 2-thiouridine(34) synthase MnmA [Candidatus Parcubacteria bacterium]|nr:MAG: tRNA 2-thiouridine(34) synthase MnmA [Candidatus Parcubacteria bacterium]